MVVRSIETVVQRTVNPDRCATDAPKVLALWRRLGRPPPAEFEADVAMVAHAARECPDRLFARDIRAEGWAEGRDRSRAVPTLLSQERWTERLDAARAWEAAGHPRAGPERPTAAKPADSRQASRREALDALDMALFNLNNLGDSWQARPAS